MGVVWEQGDEFSCPYCKEFVGVVAYEIREGMHTSSDMFVEGEGMHFEDGDPFRCERCENDLMDEFLKGRKDEFLKGRKIGPTFH